jgi:hypothetical protein
MEAQLRALTMTLHHRTDAFRTLMRETLDHLRYYFNTRNDVILFASSGTGAMEGAVSNLLSPGDRVLIGTAGKFGERWVQLTKTYGIESVVVEAPYGHTVPISEMKKHLEAGGPFRAVFIQATETSTGVSHDVKALGELVKRLTAVYESGSATPWRPDLSGEMPQRLLRMIVGFEIDILEVQGKFKLNQNRSTEDQRRVIERLRQGGSAAAVAVAELMSENLQAK